MSDEPLKPSDSDPPASDPPPSDPPASDPPPSDPPPSDPPDSDPPSSGGLSLDDVDVRDMLRAALKAPEPESQAIAKGVQRKIRENTKGRYFADGWSTTEAPKATFLITSVIMLVVVVLAFFLLSPRGLELLTK